MLCKRLNHGGGGIGSLDTVFDYTKSTSSGVMLLDDFKQQLDKIFHPHDIIDLNQRLYLIWKLQVPWCHGRLPITSHRTRHQVPI
jgi:hypothetical protein